MSPLDARNVTTTRDDRPKFRCNLMVPSLVLVSIVQAACDTGGGRKGKVNPPTPQAPAVGSNDSAPALGTLPPLPPANPASVAQTEKTNAAAPAPAAPPAGPQTELTPTPPGPPPPNPGQLLEQALGGLSRLVDSLSWSASTNRREAEYRADSYFFRALHGEVAGGIWPIGESLSDFQAIIASEHRYGPSPLAHARIGFLKLWQYLERWQYSEDDLKNPMFDANLLAKECYEAFGRASTLDSGNQLYAGFNAACSMLWGSLSNQPMLILEGGKKAAEAIRRLPEFNLFTIAYTMSTAKPTDKQYRLAMDMMYKTLSLCFSHQNSVIEVTANNLASLGQGLGPEFLDLIPQAKLTDKKYCFNSETAPHNWEGFFMVFGDMLLKDPLGGRDLAREAYKLAKVAEYFRDANGVSDYSKWPYKNLLEKRLEILMGPDESRKLDLVRSISDAPLSQSQAHVVEFRNRYAYSEREPYVFYSKQACAVCHRSRP